MFSTILVTGRWAAEKHPERMGPDKWTRDMAAEYVADTMTATMPSDPWSKIMTVRTAFQGGPSPSAGVHSVYFGENERPFRCTTSFEMPVRHTPKWLFVFVRDTQHSPAVTPDDGG
jgi:hypothetical protein